MKPISEMSQIEIAAFIQSHFNLRGIKLVLSGGAATSYYCYNEYISADLDLINVFSILPRKIGQVMEELGFHEKGRYFVHPESKFIVEFPPGPLMVGTESVLVVAEFPVATGTLFILSATDCVKDRLAAFYHWGDEQCLRQAILVKNAVKVDLSEIERWSVKEGKLQEFERFLSEG
jgi:hypothetical protein